MNLSVSPDEWLRTRLFEQRTVVVRGPLTHELVGHAAADIPMPTQIVDTSQRTCCMAS